LKKLILENINQLFKMMLFALWWISISKASLNYKHLVTNVANTFDDCLNVAADVEDYLSDVDALGNVRRRLQDGGHAAQLRACVSMLKVMDLYRHNHSKLTLAQGVVHWQERTYLNQLLKPLSKKMAKIPIYLASKDGDRAVDFHEKCDNKGPTVVIVETTTGNVFGGYTGVSWSRSISNRRAPTSFLFQLRPNLSQFGLRDINARKAVYHHEAFGPCFGAGRDLCIYGGALKSYYNFVNGITYRADKFTLNNGTRHFKVKDYVVFQAIAL